MPRIFQRYTIQFICGFMNNNTTEILLAQLTIAEYAHRVHPRIEEFVWGSCHNTE